MTKADELNALADKCEREEAGRKLDRAIAATINGGDHFPYCLAYTTSLDAAVSLVPEGWRASDLCWDGDNCRFCLFHEASWRHASAAAKSEVMARVAAALRARAALSAALQAPSCATAQDR
jgi:hypothetical protein